MKSTVSGMCSGEARSPRGEADLAEDGLHRQLDSGHARDPGRPGACGAHDRPGLDAPALRLDAADLAVRELDPGDRAAGGHRRAVPARARRRIPARPPPGSRGRRAARRSLRARRRARRAGRAAAPPRATRTGSGRRVRSAPRRPARTPDVLLPVEQEEVADLLQVDLRTGSLGEADEGLQAAQAERDVERVRELRPHAACGPARRARRELGLLEQHDVHARFGEVERRARADHASPDDDGVGPLGQAAHLRSRFRRKKRTFAGRSARRRIR